MAYTICYPMVTPMTAQKSGVNTKSSSSNMLPRCEVESVREMQKSVFEELTTVYIALLVRAVLLSPCARRFVSRRCIIFVSLFKDQTGDRKRLCTGSWLGFGHFTTAFCSAL